MTHGFVNFANIIDESKQGIVVSFIVHVVMEIDMKVLLHFS